MHRVLPILALAGVSLTIAGCANDTPVSPTPSAAVPTASAAADGSTLKVNAPSLLAPINGAMLSTLRPTLEIGGASGLFVAAPYAYAYEVQNTSGTVVRSQTVDGTSWTLPDDLANDTGYQWRARAVRNGAVGPWSGLQAFRTARVLAGCVNGVLADPRAYFFFLINRTEGSSARDWESVLRNSGIPAGPGAGQRIAPNAPFYGITQQIASNGSLRGRVFLPSNSPDPSGYFILTVDVLSDPSGSSWVWRVQAGPPYTPRACP